MDILHKVIELMLNVEDTKQLDKKKVVLQLLEDIFTDNENYQNIKPYLPIFIDLIIEISKNEVNISNLNKNKCFSCLSFCTPNLYKDEH